MLKITSRGTTGSCGIGIKYDLGYKDFVLEFGFWYIAIGVRKMSELRRNWLKTYFGIRFKGEEKVKSDKLVDNLSDRQVDELVNEIRTDLIAMVDKTLVFDSDFVEYLTEQGYEGEIDMEDLILEFADWLAEETVTA